MRRGSIIDAFGSFFLSIFGCPSPISGQSRPLPSISPKSSSSLSCLSVANGYETSARRPRHFLVHLSSTDGQYLYAVIPLKVDIYAGGSKALAASSVMDLQRSPLCAPIKTVANAAIFGCYYRRQRFCSIHLHLLSLLPILRGQGDHGDLRHLEKIAIISNFRHHHNAHCNVSIIR